jgi:DNA-binding IclR family transcriptional regulator
MAWMPVNARARDNRLPQPITEIPDEDVGTDTSPGTVQAVERSLRLLLTLAHAPRPRTLQELSIVMGCSISTVHRMLTTLSDVNLVEKEPVRRRYRLGPAVFDLAAARSRQTDLRELAHRHLEGLSDASLETVTLELLVNTHVVCLDRIESVQELRLVSALGGSTPISELGAKCKAVLAYLPLVEQERVLDQVRWERVPFTRSTLRDELAKTRDRGVARSFGERVPVAASMAAPIFGSHGQVVASIAVAGPNGRWTAAAMDALQPSLQAAVKEISYDLGYRDPGIDASTPSSAAAIAGAVPPVEAARSAAAEKG